MEGIHINQVLALMAESGDRPFRLSFVRATGKTRGSIRAAVCYYGAPNPKDRQAPTEGQKRKKRSTHLESGTVPLTEAGSRALLTPLISHILTFEGKKVYK